MSAAHPSPTWRSPRNAFSELLVPTPRGIKRLGRKVGEAELVLLLAAAAVAYELEGKRVASRRGRGPEPWEILYGMTRKRFRGLPKRLGDAAAGRLTNKQLSRLAADLRDVDASLSGPSELNGKLGVASNYPNLRDLAEGLVGSPDSTALAPTLRQAKRFIRQECISNKGPNSPERMGLASAIERAIVAHVRKSAGKPSFGQIAILLEAVFRAFGGSTRSRRTRFSQILTTPRTSVSESRSQAHPRSRPSTF